MVFDRKEGGGEGVALEPLHAAPFRPWGKIADGQRNDSDSSLARPGSREAQWWRRTTHSASIATAKPSLWQYAKWTRTSPQRVVLHHLPTIPRPGWWSLGREGRGLEQEGNVAFFLAPQMTEAFPASRRHPVWWASVISPKKLPGKAWAGGSCQLLPQSAIWFSK